MMTLKQFELVSMTMELELQEMQLYENASQWATFEKHADSGII